MNTKQGAIYIRVSSQTQADGESLGVQLADCRSQADRDGVSSSDDLVFRDEGVSAKARRPALDALVRAAEDGRFEVVYVWKMSRFGRTAGNTLQLVDRLREAGVTVHFVKDGFGSDQKALLGILSVMAEIEWDNIREQSVAGMEAAAEKGHFMGSQPPFGTRSVLKDGETRGKVLEEDPETADVIRDAARMVTNDGASTGDIARMWNSQGFLSPRGKSWTHQNVQRLLTSRRLAGEYWWKEYPIDHPVIVDPDEFEGLQHALAVRRRGKRRGNRDSWLSGRIRCTCGGLYVSSGRHGTRGWSASYYRCSRNRASLGSDRCPERRWLNAEMVESAVWWALGGILPKSPSMASAVVDPSLLSPNLEYVDSGWYAPPVTYELLNLVDDPTERTRIDGEIAAARSELERRSRGRIATLVEAAKTGSDELRQAASALEAEVQESEAAIRRLESRAAIVADAANYETEFHRVVAELVEIGTTQDPGKRREVVGALDVRIFLKRDGGSVLITGSPHRYIRRFDMKSCQASRRRSRIPLRR